MPTQVDTTPCLTGGMETLLELIGDTRKGYSSD
jgi:hypothetical protein